MFGDGYRAQVLLQRLSQHSPRHHRKLRQQSSAAHCQRPQPGAGGTAGAPQ